MSISTFKLQKITQIFFIPIFQNTILDNEKYQTYVLILYYKLLYKAFIVVLYKLTNVFNVTMFTNAY